MSEDSAENFNSLTRVSSIMESAKRNGANNDKAVDVWLNAFEIESVGQPQDTFEVIHKLRLLLNELNTSEELINNSRAPQKGYANAISKMRQAIQPSNVAATWTNFGGKYELTDTNVLVLLAAFVSDEQIVDDESIEDFSQAVEEFKDHVSGLEEGALRDYAVAQIVNMERAISDYPIVGTKAFEQGMKDFVGETFFNIHVCEENKDTETMDWARRIAGKLFNIVQYTAPMIQSAAGLQQLLGIGGE